MNIILTGCCGHIGSYIVHNLARIKKVKKAYIVDNLKSNRFSSLFYLWRVESFKKPSIGIKEITFNIFFLF